MIPSGRSFYKMSGSGNDFVIVDARHEPPGLLLEPDIVQAVCSRGTGVGADGIVFLELTPVATLRMTYLNSDGSLASMCGNAALCSTRLAVELGAAPSEGFTLETDSGVLPVRMKAGKPEVDLAPVSDVRESFPADLGRGERRLGFALAGVPHLVMRCDDVETVDVVGRGRPLRHREDLPDGANVNFVSRESDGSGWRIRTYERGVEGETLACGTGAVSTAILLAAWGDEKEHVALRTRSGRVLGVELRRRGREWHPTLSGEARVVYVGTLGEL